MLIRQMQLGKQGITENFINSLKNQFKNSQVIKVYVLKSASRDRKEIIMFKDDILEKLGKNFTGRIIGFTIILRKWRLTFVRGKNN
ncbi:MAG: YhbY family RNA-binding protein [Nanoarchaeota archaeon]